MPKPFKVPKGFEVKDLPAEDYLGIADVGPTSVAFLNEWPQNIDEEKSRFNFFEAILHTLFVWQ